MGKKSDKKVRSDRINALRKQYDAFLEDDKKRKERNEYILGRLDNMRYTSTAVQLRHKPSLHGDLYPTHNRMEYRPDMLVPRDIQVTHPSRQITRPTYHSQQLDFPGNIEDSAILKEISKKYILIPKLKPTLSNDYVKTISPQAFPQVSIPKASVINNDDWKSKYDILEQLKNTEKEEGTNKYVNDDVFPVKEKDTLNKHIFKNDSDGYEMQNYKTEEAPSKYEQEVPEKEISYNKSEVERETQNIDQFKITENKEQSPESDLTPLSSSAAHMDPDTNAVYDYALQNQGLEYNTPANINTINVEENIEEHIQPTQHIPATENMTEVEHDIDNVNQVTEYHEQEEYPIVYEALDDGGKDTEIQNVYDNENDSSPIQVLNPTEFVEEINKEENIVDETKEVDNTKYPIDAISVAEFTPYEDVKLQDGENVNPEQYNFQPTYDNNPATETVDEHAEVTVDPTDTSGIEAFDAENREMFYSGEPEENYDQQGAGDAYNQEYAQNENDTQNQEYGYYAEQEQAEYPAEINEYTETEQKYDQNYEQQYTADAQAYDQQAYEQQQQQYDQQPVEGYQEQEYQEYQYEQPDPETVQNVEQVLDHEQGYDQQQNVEINEGKNSAIMENQKTAEQTAT